MKNWRVHSCLLDEECRKVGAGTRTYFHTPWGSLIVALKVGDGMQVWLPLKGWTLKWFPIVWHPKG